MPQNMKLWEPGRIGGLSLKNRIIMSAMHVLPLPDGRLSKRLIDYYAARARGGVGLIITCAVHVSREIEHPEGSRAFTTPMADDKMYVAGFSELADAVHDWGAKICVQFMVGGGRNVSPDLLRTVGAVGPSPNPSFFDPTIISRELTTKEVERLVQQVKFATQVVRNAGIDAIEINMHGGYLTDEFTSGLWNRRTDKYGGSLEGRLRLSMELIEAIKSAAGSDFPVIFKFGLAHYIPGGRGVEEGLGMTRRWEAAGLDALCIDAGVYETRYWESPPTTQPMGCTVHLAEMVKQVVKIPVIAIGKLGDPALAEKVLREEKADFVALGRPLLADPEWANKVRDGRLDDIRPCIGDHEGCRKRVGQSKYVSCSVNPATGMEKEMTIEQAQKKRSVLVVGGGPAGMEAARVAAMRGHKVALYEKQNRLGGNLAAAAVPEFKQEYRRLIDHLSNQIKKLRVDVRLSTTATPELVKEINPDVLLIATGSEPVIPEIPGLTNANSVSAVDLLLGKCEAGASVAVIGGGVVGCETALFLARKGKNVTVVEISDDVLSGMYSINRMHLLKLLEDAKVTILRSSKVLQINGSGISIAGKDGRRNVLAAETIVIAAGFKPNNQFIGFTRGLVPETYPLGDCVSPRKVINAMWEAFRTARLI